ncbi:MAG: protease pro-enzyme activation domain-containing protein, partial [Acidobacteriota bacterium]|nr:protease pro-enzyme activation domain-containing protein [Acidobacteriota bacterium]
MPHRIFALFGAFFLFVSLGLAAKDRIAGRPESGRLATLRNTVHPQARLQLDRGSVDPSMRIDYATLMLKPAAGLEVFLASQQDPNSADYHRWLTPEQFGDRFGLSANDMATVVSWLKDQGFTIHDVARGRHWITFSGTAGQVSKAFKTEIHRYLVDGVTHFANWAPLSVPGEFESVVSGVSGLDDFRPDPQYRLRTSAADYNLGSSHYLAPDDLATIYNIAPLYRAGIDGTGQKIAIIGRTDIDLADIRSFRSRFGLPASDQQVVLFGTDPGTTSDLIEADLDLEWAGAIARNATLIYVNSTNIRTSAQYAVDQNLAPVMTYSYGSCEQQT